MKDVNENIKADIVIIGGGGSGLAAALAAAEKGVENIIILEKRATFGGNTALATGLFACESPVQAREKIVADKDELFKRAMKYAHYDRINPRIVRSFINKSGDTIRWLEQMGLEFNIIPFIHNQQPRVWHCPKGKGARLTQVLVEKCQALEIKMLLKCGGKKILRDKKGYIKGVMAEDEGRTFEIFSRSVIITTGGFGGNKRYLKKYCSPYYDGLTLRGLRLSGDGLAMAREAGASVNVSATLLKEGPRVDLNTWPLMGLERAASTIWLNKSGQRFVDEAVGDYPFESVNAILLQPDKVCYVLMDSVIKNEYEKTKSELEAGIKKEVKKNNLIISKSWDDIAQWIGIDSRAIRQTVEGYNIFCDQGYDEDFAKDRRYLMPLRKAPFYAVRTQPVFLDTLGGININERMEVMDNHSNPIPGLYGAGVITSGWIGANYCSELSGSAFGYAINSGRMAGENAGKFIARH